MRNYAIATKITSLITGLSLIAVLIIHYGFAGNEAEFWCNVLLAVFGSALLSAISSFLGYNYEKRRTLENFSYSTRALLHVLNKYDLKWNDEKKMNFFLSYNDIDKSMWDGLLGDIYFLCDKDREKFKYVYEKIYSPILKVNQKVGGHEFHFIWHKDGSGKNDAVMHDFIGEIEPLIMETKVIEHQSPEGEMMSMTTTKNKLVHSILEELNGHYYELMYSKKQAERMEA